MERQFFILALFSLLLLGSCGPGLCVPYDCETVGGSVVEEFGTAGFILIPVEP